MKRFPHFLHRLGWLLLIVALSLGSTAFRWSPLAFGLPFFSFEQPQGDALTADDEMPFSLRVPRTGPRNLALFLDGQPISRDQWTRSGWHVDGRVTDLAQGDHELRAQLKLRIFWRFTVKLRARTRFEVAASPSFRARGSLEQVHITCRNAGTCPAEGTRLQLHDGDGRFVAEGDADGHGSLIFREVPPGDGYTVRTTRSSLAAAREMDGPVSVGSVAGSTPDPSFYAGQSIGLDEIASGDTGPSSWFGYIETRDGTRLSAFVSLPGPVEDGPYPTLVNYSGYSPSQPGEPQTFNATIGDQQLIFLLSLVGIECTKDVSCEISLCPGGNPLIPGFGVLCETPNHPSGFLGGVLGFATVGVNMRGTGCSGGAYDFFEPLQVTDGYDVIETVAAQPWVLHNKVGMAGLSYPGISQLFVASAQPPSLAAITPLSAISTTSSVLGPGGILNDGFALEWATQVLDRADPYGQGWEQGRVDAGDTTCEENQRLHAQKVDIIEKARSFPFYVPEIYDPLNPVTFADRIEVPVFTAGSWQDEQVGGYAPGLWDKFVGAPVVRITGYNGAHADGYTPQILTEWKTFLDLYVTRQVRAIHPALLGLAPPLFNLLLYGVDVPLAQVRFAPTETEAEYEAARAAYEAEDPIRIIFENGAEPGGTPGSPIGSFEEFFTEWPLPETVAERWYLHENGQLSQHAPLREESASSFRHDPLKGQETMAGDGNFDRAIPNLTWLPWKEGRQAVFVSEPLDDDLVMVGHASVDLWVQSNADDADLEVVLSEVRPDGQETYVQSGWLRASQRKLYPECPPDSSGPCSTALRPVATHSEADASPLPAGRWTEVRVELYPFAHVFRGSTPERAGSRIRISVETPGANRGRWRFDTLEFDGDVEHAVSHSSAHASSVLLPVLPGIVATPELPRCPSLRAQPCRAYAEHLNTGFVPPPPAAAPPPALERPRERPWKGWRWLRPGRGLRNGFRASQGG